MFNKNLPKDYEEENRAIFNQPFHDIYLSIIIHILGGLELKFIRDSGQIDSDRDKKQQIETDLDIDG